MKHEEYQAKRRRDPEYRKVEKRLKPVLDLLDGMFCLRMGLRARLAALAKTKRANK